MLNETFSVIFKHGFTRFWYLAPKKLSWLQACSVSFMQVFLECAENSTNLGNQFGSKRENKNPYLVSQLILKRSVTFLLDIWIVLEVKISTSPRPKSAVFQFTENLKKSWGQRRKGNPIRYLVEISSGFSVNHPLPATFSASKSQEP